MKIDLDYHSLKTHVWLLQQEIQSVIRLNTVSFDSDSDIDFVYSYTAIVYSSI